MNIPSIPFRSLLLAVFIAACVLVSAQLHAQDPNLGQDNIKYTNDFAKANHLIAQVFMESGPEKTVHFHYDRYPDLKLITEDGVTYAQARGKAWLKSRDGGKIGTPVKADKAEQFEWYASIAEASLAEPVRHDQSQGATVWKFIERTAKDDLEYFTYERTREHPNPDGLYPTFRFLKYKNNTDGHLLLEHSSGNMRDDKELFRVEVKYSYKIIVPFADVKLEKAPAAPKKKK